MTPYPTNRNIITDLQNTTNIKYAEGKQDGMTELANRLQKEIIQERLHMDSENQDYKTGFLCALSIVEGLISWIMCEEEDKDD